jgi:hypothetical protein
MCRLQEPALVVVPNGPVRMVMTMRMNLRRVKPRQLTVPRGRGAKGGVKAELVEEDDNAGPPAAVPRRRTSRSVKAEAARAAQEASSSAGASRATRTS